MQQLLDAQFNKLQLDITGLDWRSITYGLKERGVTFDYCQGRYHTDREGMDEYDQQEEEDD